LHRKATCSQIPRVRLVFLTCSLLRSATMARHRRGSVLRTIFSPGDASGLIPLLIGDPWVHTAQEDEEAPASLQLKGAQTTVQSTDGGHSPSDEPHLCYENEKNHPKPSTIQLFYDLFFVANLTTFTSRHQMNDGSSKFPLIPAIFSTRNPDTLGSVEILYWLL
jgi:hypothetical protein